MKRDWKPGDVAVAAFRVYAAGGPEWATVRIVRFEQVARLASVLVWAMSPADVARLAESLRWLLQSPKPDEPTGLGAIVEDRDGVRWTLTMKPPGSTEPQRFPWCREHIAANGERFAEWADISVARVLSEGWSE